MKGKLAEKLVKNDQNSSKMDQNGAQIDFDHQKWKKLRKRQQKRKKKTNENQKRRKNQKWWQNWQKNWLKTSKIPQKWIKMEPKRNEITKK